MRYVPDWFPGRAFTEKAHLMAAQLNRTTDQPHSFVKPQMHEQNYKPPFFVSSY